MPCLFIIFSLLKIALGCNWHIISSTYLKFIIWCVLIYKYVYVCTYICLFCMKTNTVIKLMNISRTPKKFPGVPLWFFPPTPPPHVIYPQAPADLCSVSINGFALSRSLYKWNHMVLLFLCLAPFVQQSYFEIPPCCSMNQSIPHSFLLLRHIPLCGYSVVCLSTHLLMGVWIIFIFGLYQRKPQWTFIYKSFWDMYFHFSG